MPNEIACWIQEGDSKDVLVDQIVHNWQRADLKPEGEISKFLAIHDWVAPEVQQMAREQSDTETPLTMRHLYNLSKIDDLIEQQALAQRVRDENLTATQVEELVTKPRFSAIARKVGGVSLRQRRYQTTHHVLPSANQQS